MRIRVQRNGHQRRDSGYMLLVLMLAVAVLTITMLGVARNYRRSIQRDREVEMIHRGEQYSRAVKRYYKKFGRYPTTIEQLENTNKIRFLRKRYKDPMSPDGQWKIAHATDIKLPGIGAGAAGTVAGVGAAVGATSAFSGVGGSLTQTNLVNASGNAVQDGQGTEGTVTGTTTGSSSSFTGTATQGTGTSSSDSGSTGPTGTGNATNQVLGGGDMLGVVSKAKTDGIHSFGDKRRYSEWFFIYVPTQDIGTALLTGPYNPKMFIGSANSGLDNTNKPGTGSAFGSSTPTSPTTTTPATPTTTP
ncbi:MAG TPA: hypothetical protein VM578_11025 [Candidatus Saccharimonadales bacterium]|nr:hypothetical protein [Candidatus Saccharimonadales bacterium]